MLLTNPEFRILLDGLHQASAIIWNVRDAFDSLAEEAWYHEDLWANADFAEATAALKRFAAYSADAPDPIAGAVVAERWLHMCKEHYNDHQPFDPEWEVFDVEHLPEEWRAAWHAERAFTKTRALATDIRKILGSGDPTPNGLREIVCEWRSQGRRTGLRQHLTNATLLIKKTVQIIRAGDFSTRPLLNHANLLLKHVTGVAAKGGAADEVNRASTDAGAAAANPEDDQDDFSDVKLRDGDLNFLQAALELEATQNVYRPSNEIAERAEGPGAICPRDRRERLKKHGLIETAERLGTALTARGERFILFAEP